MDPRLREDDEMGNPGPHVRQTQPLDWIAASLRSSR